MSRKALWLLFVAAMPGVVCAQEFKVTNCRTLESAGNFVGPDEVIMNDLVCTKLKPGAEAAKPEVPKPIPGAVISDSDSTSVVDAAKAANKRTAAAKEAIKEKAEQTQNEADPATEAVPDTNPPPADNPEIPHAPPEPANTSPAAKPAAPAPSRIEPTLNVEPKPSAREVAAARQAAREAAPAPEAAPPEPTETATAPTEPAQGSANGAAEVVPPPAPAAATETANVPAAPSAAVAAEEAAGTKAEGNEAPAQPASPQEPTRVPAAVTPQPAEAPAAEAGPGFYDANAGAKVVTNPRPDDSVKIETVTSAPAKAPAEVSAEVAAAARNAAEAQAALLAPDPNLPRERVIQTGAFLEPKEEGPDPAAEAHKTTFLPGDTEGFEEGHRPGCTKNITLGGLKGEKLVLGTPGWAEKWIEKNQKRIPEVCFSDTPMKGAKNYLIVFYTSPANSNGPEVPDTPNNSLAPQGTPAGGVGAFTLSYGSTWHYAVDRTVGVTVLTRDEADQPYSQPGQVRYATAYTEEGMPLVEHWPQQPKKEILVDTKKPNSKKSREARAELEHVSDDLLGQIVDDLAKM